MHPRYPVESRVNPESKQNSTVESHPLTRKVKDDAACGCKMSSMIRVILPFHLRNLAHVGSEVTLEVEGPVTQRSVLDALEARYPMLRGAIRDHDTLQRRPFLRFFACEEDLSHEEPDAPLPDAVASGKEPFIVIGAIAGG